MVNDTTIYRISHRGGKLFFMLGAALLLTGLLANEWALAWLFSPDGSLSPKSRMWVRACGLTFILAGLAVLSLRGRLARSVAGRLGRHPEAVALGLGCMTSLILLACVEVPLLFLNNAREHRPAAPRTYSPGFFAEDPLLGRRPLPSNRYTESVSLHGAPLFSETYAIDENRCRVVPVQPTQPTDRALLFFGCSFTFGTGVNDDETLPCQTARLLPRRHVYNFAGVGDGAHQMLAQLTQTDLTRRVQEHEATAVYVFIPQHLERSIMTMRHAVKWGRNDPSFAVGPDHAVSYLGPVSRAHPWRLLFYDILAHEQILRRMNANWPPAITEKHIQYNADLVTASSKALHERFTPARFEVLFCPLSPQVSAGLGVDWDHVKDVFERAGLHVLDYRKLAEPGEEGLFYPVDEHPTAKMHERIAARLAQDLEDQSIARPER